MLALLSYVLYIVRLAPRRAEEALKGIETPLPVGPGSSRSRRSLHAGECHQGNSDVTHLRVALNQLHPFERLDMLGDAIERKLKWPTISRIVALSSASYAKLALRTGCARA